MSRLRRTAAILAAATATLAAAGPAQASAQTTTHWYTIDVEAPSAASPALFLGTHDRFSDAKVELTRYRSGDPSMQWTPVSPRYPAAEDVTGAPNPISRIIGAFTCAGATSGSCDFSGHASAKLKFVNRESGRCISVIDPWTRNGNGTAIVAADCWRDRDRQIWDVTLADVASRTYTTLRKTRPQNPGATFCGGVNKGNVHDHRRSAGSPLQAWRCQGTANEHLRFLEAGESTCTPPTYAQLCGIGGSRP